MTPWVALQSLDTWLNRTTSAWCLLRFKLALNLLTRGLITRCPFSASRVSVATFKSSKSHASSYCSIHPFASPFTVHLLCNFCILCALSPYESSRFSYFQPQRYGFSYSMTPSLYCVAFVTAWDCLCFLHFGVLFVFFAFLPNFFVPFPFLDLSRGWDFLGFHLIDFFKTCLLYTSDAADE